MADRRQFLRTSLLGASALAVPPRPAIADATGNARKSGMVRVVCPWDLGAAANQAAWAVPAHGGHVLDAVEAGVRVSEADLRHHSVGRAVPPDRDAHVSLDASTMEAEGNCGAGAAIEHINHPISVARRVMERTPHVRRGGEGAQQFVLEQGFQKEDQLTRESEKARHERLKTAHYVPLINSEVPGCRKTNRNPPGGKDNHDTIGMLALDTHGKTAGAGTTSGMAWKLRGRLDDGPIICVGLCVGGDVSGAISTGVDEDMSATPAACSWWN